MSDFNTGIPEIDAIHTLADMMSYAKTRHHETEAKRRQPILCNECGSRWMQCTCDGTHMIHRLFAFRGISGEAIKVWTCEDVVFISQETDKGEESLLFAEAELTEIAERWLRHVKETDV